ncbi:unnamed protein product [Paramecium primaurelia]|uniref:Radial spoke head protein 9 homolog n=1 Tax=Paramecium primaurelia TaxID=5886 RepID=A0A8S1N5R8_PARPR|nr:unnamed protein product [Paramecium primaurelia]
MEIYRIPEDLRFVNQIGQTLSAEEKIKLEIALIKLSQTQTFDQLLFWGRIEGTVANYYIAIGLNFKNNFEFPHKTFFYTANLKEFQNLPPLNPEYKEQVETFRQLFSGQPEKILINITGEDGDQPPADQPNPDEPQPVVKNDDDSDVEIKPPPKNFLEVDRLAYVVNAIEFECALLPVGAVRLTPTHELRYNDSFEGLNLQEASKIINYQHFRAPQSPNKKELIAQDDALFHYDFFDQLDDHPVGQWSLQTDSSKYQVTIRNLQWPGFLGYHRAGTRIFGYAYFGDGIKNVDLAFQL